MGQPVLTPSRIKHYRTYWHLSKRPWRLFILFKIENAAWKHFPFPHTFSTLEDFLCFTFYLVIFKQNRKPYNIALITTCLLFLFNLFWSFLTSFELLSKCIQTEKDLNVNIKILCDRIVRDFYSFILPFCSLQIFKHKCVVAFKIIKVNIV